MFHLFSRSFDSEGNDNMKLPAPALLKGGVTPADPLVFGFWKVPKDSCAMVCYEAIKAGYRRLDCACDYGA